MKLLVIVLALGMTGCGLQGQINEIKNKTNQNADQIDSVQARVAALESQMEQNKAELVSLGIQLEMLQADSSANSSQIIAVGGAVAALQLNLNTALVQIAVLQGYKNIVAIKDPCGAQGAYNEVFLQLSSGQYLASFSENVEGRNTRFTVLTDGTFTTTDNTHCT